MFKFGRSQFFLVEKWSYRDKTLRIKILDVFTSLYKVYEDTEVVQRIKSAAGLLFLNHLLEFGRIRKDKQADTPICPKCSKRT